MWLDSATTSLGMVWPLGPRLARTTVRFSLCAGFVPLRHAIPFIVSALWPFLCASGYAQRGGRLALLTFPALAYSSLSHELLGRLPIPITSGFTVLVDNRQQLWGAPTGCSCRWRRLRPFPPPPLWLWSGFSLRSLHVRHAELRGGEGGVGLVGEGGTYSCDTYSALAPPLRCYAACWTRR